MMQDNRLHILFLCAGKGTRLHPLTKSVPKPLLSLGEITILERLIRQSLTAFNVESIWVNTSYLPEKICSHLAKMESNTLNILWEPTILGSASTLLEISKRVTGDILVIHGDLVLSNSYIDELSKKVYSAKKSFVVCHLRDSTDARSVVQVSTDGNVKSLREKYKGRKGHQVLSNSGIYFFLANEDLSASKGLDIVNSQLQSLISSNLLGSAVIHNPRVSVDSLYSLEQAVILANGDKLMKLLW